MEPRGLLEGRHGRAGGIVEAAGDPFDVLPGGTQPALQIGDVIAGGADPEG